MFATVRLGLLRQALWGAASALLAACSPAWISPLERDHPLAGRIFDARIAKEVSREELLRRAIASRFVVLGETHDNADHHRLQAEVLGAMVRAGRTPALAMEQFDQEHQPALDASRTRGERDPERVADAGRFDRKGWQWPDYKPLVDLAVANALPVLAANLSREEARAMMRTGRASAVIAPAPEALQAQLERDIVEGHCGIRPPAGLLRSMVEVQRSRDARMAATLEGAGESGAVLIAGAGHARRDRGVPAYLPKPAQGAILVIAFVEIAVGKTEPAGDYGEQFDLVWYTPRAAREDPCRTLRLRGIDPPSPN